MSYLQSLLLILIYTTLGIILISLATNSMTIIDLSQFKSKHTQFDTKSFLNLNSKDIFLIETLPLKQLICNISKPATIDEFINNYNKLKKKYKSEILKFLGISVMSQNTWHFLNYTQNKNYPQAQLALKYLNCIKNFKEFKKII